MKPYSVSATKAMGVVEMNTPAIGMKEQMNTNSDRSPMPADGHHNTCCSFTTTEGSATMHSSGGVETGPY